MDLYQILSIETLQLMESIPKNFENANLRLLKHHPFVFVTWTQVHIIFVESTQEPNIGIYFLLDPDLKLESCKYNFKNMGKFFK
jgi:hypothetical protein